MIKFTSRRKINSGLWTGVQCLHCAQKAPMVIAWRLTGRDFHTYIKPLQTEEVDRLGVARASILRVSLGCTSG